MTNSIQMDRRLEKRTCLKYACSFTIFTEEGMIPFDMIDLFDLSKDGLSFILTKDFGVFTKGEILQTRLYMNSLNSQNSRYYLPLQLRVTNSTEFIDRGGNKVRYGCNIDHPEENSKQLLRDFIRFIESSAAYLKEDRGDYFISNTVA